MSSEAMFSEATANFVRQIDPEGSLIHVARINDSNKLVPMALVVKRNRFWFWQRPKYHPTAFKLSDVLLGDRVLSIGLIETDFLTYNGTFGDKHSGNLDTEVGSVSVTLEGRGSSKLQCSFGELKKEELDEKKLIQDSRDRQVDMQHVLVRQLEKRSVVLAVVKERIFTTTTCSVTQKKQEQHSFQGMLGLLGIEQSRHTVCVKNSTDIEVESDVSLEVPSGTVIAYSVLELYIKKDGHYEICLQPGNIGGFEAEMEESGSSQDPFDAVDGFRCWIPEEEPLSAQQNGSEEEDLSPLAELPESTRWALFQNLQETLKDRVALSYLQCKLEEMFSGETLEMAQQEEPSESQIQLLLDTLDHILSDAASLHAALLLVSAMEELPDETLSLMTESSPDFLKAFDSLMCRLKDSSQPLSIQSLPVHLQESQAFQLAEQLLRSTNVTLGRDADSLWVENGNESAVRLLVLYLSIHGLSLLCSGQTPA